MIKPAAAQAVQCQSRHLGSDAKPKRSYRFAIVPKVAQPWFELVYQGARDAAAYLGQMAAVEVAVEYRAPSEAKVVEQNEILRQLLTRPPDGIAIDLLDAAANRSMLQEVQDRGIHLVVFDSVAPEGMALTAIGNDFRRQAEIASERLVQIIGGQGKVAIMQGVPTAPNHRIRYECHKAVFNRFRDIELVAEGVDNDSIEQAQQQAAAIMARHRDLDGWVACDAAGGIGIGRAIKQAGITGKVKLVGIDNLPEMLKLIEEGVADSSSSTRPHMQGFYSVIMLYDAVNGIVTPKAIDTGILFVTAGDLDGKLR